MTPKSKTNRRKRRDGQLIPRGQNKWLVRYYTGLTPDGRRGYASQIVHGSRKDAQSALSTAVKSIADKTYKQPTSLTVGKFLDDWLENVWRLKVRETTLRGYKVHVDNLPPSLRSLKLRDLRAEHLQSHYAAVSPSVARHTHSVVRAAMNHALRTGVIERSPCEHVVLPQHAAREIQFLSEGDLAKLLAVERVTYKEDGRMITLPNRHRVLFSFLASTGARPSEALGLQWQDVDLDRGTVAIRRTLQWHSRNQGGGYYFAPPKTKKSERSVPLPSGLVGLLRQHKVKQAEALLKVGVRSPLVFTTSAGTPIMRRNLVRRYFKPALAAAGLPFEFTLYHLRHSSASLLLNRGVNVKAISERLGHSSIKITVDTYCAALPSLQAEAAQEIDVALFG